MILPGRRARSALALAVALVLGACSSGGGTSAADDAPANGSRRASSTTSLSPTTPAVSGQAAAAAPAAVTSPLPPTTVPPAAPPITPLPATPPPAVPGLPTEVGVLRSGTKGVRTLALQQALADAKYDPGAIDGSFGLNTTLALWAWQGLHGQPRTGVVDAGTEALILARPTLTMKRPDLGPTHTEIDLTGQTIVVFKDGRPSLVSHVSSGSGRRYCSMGSCGTAVTPLGTYRYDRRVKGWRVAPLGRLYNPVYFNGGIAVHGSGSVPNTPASHGCVRIPMHIAEYFPTLVANGDPVVVLRS